MSSIQIFRIVKSKHVMTAFDGEGARNYEGRWNSNGFSVVYTSGSLSLAALETLVNLDSFPPIEMKYSSILALLPSGLAIEFLENLPPDWNSNPPSMTTQERGTLWLKNSKSAVLRVPSAIIHTEYNYLLNPLHSDFRKIKINDPVPFKFGHRFQRLFNTANS